MVVQQDFEKVAPFMVQEIRSLKKLAIFFRVSRWGRKGGGGGGGWLVRGTLRYFPWELVVYINERRNI